MMRNRSRDTQPSQKEFGELFTIHIPDVISPTASEESEDAFEIQFLLQPELPSHVPTPKTIDQGLAHNIKNIFSADEDDYIIKRKRSKSRKNESPTPASPSDSPSLKKTAQTVISSPNRSKWGPDVWNSKRRKFFSVPPIMTHRPPSPSNPFDELDNSFEQTSAKLIMSEEQVETVVRPVPTTTVGTANRYHNYGTVPKKRVTSTLERRWLQENALNLHSSCRHLSHSESTSPRRSPFSFKSRARRVNMAGVHVERSEF